MTFHSLYEVLLSRVLILVINWVWFLCEICHYFCGDRQYSQAFHKAFAWFIWFINYHYIQNNAMPHSLCLIAYMNAGHRLTGLFCLFLFHFVHLYANNYVNMCMHQSLLQGFPLYLPWSILTIPPSCIFINLRGLVNNYTALSLATPIDNGIITLVTITNAGNGINEHSYCVD